MEIKKEKNRIIPVAMITDNNFIMPTCVAVTSLVNNKDEDTCYVIFIIMAECTPTSKSKIRELNLLSEMCEVKLIEAGLDKYRDFKQLAHIPISCLLKFDLCDLIPEYDKILYLDGDTIIRKDLSELYNTDLQGSYLAGVKDLQSIIEDNGNINAGIVLFNAKRIRDEQLSKKLYKVRKSLGDRASMDQQTFNIVCKKEYKYLSIKYNCVIGKLIGEQRIREYSLEKLNKLYGESYKSLDDLVSDIVIMHFATSNKPWIYTFNPGADVWYRYYKESPYKNEPFQLRSRWQYRIDKMKEAWKDEGIIGIGKRLSNRLERSLGREKKKNILWE